MRDIFKQFDIELSDQQENKLKEYYKILVEENKKMNFHQLQNMKMSFGNTF